MADPENALEHTRMSLGDHLEELRKRLFRSVVVLAVCFGVAWWFKDDIAAQVMWPWRKAVGVINADLVEKAEADLALHPGTPRTRWFTSDDPADRTLRDALDPRLTSFGIGDSFFFAMYNSIYFALFFGSPFVLWQMWQFIAAGLYAHEKRWVRFYFPFSALLFVGGVLFCFFIVIPTGMSFLATTLSLDQVKTQLSIDKYFNFLSTMCLAMGAVFQLPILMLFLSSMGLVEPSTFARYRGHFVVVALVVAAIVTPGPDAVSQLLMTGPMLLLYEFGILLARWRAHPRRHPQGDAR